MAEAFRNKSQEYGETNGSGALAALSATHSHERGEACCTRAEESAEENEGGHSPSNKALAVSLFPRRRGVAPSKPQTTFLLGKPHPKCPGARLIPRWSTTGKALVTNPSRHPGRTLFRAGSGAGALSGAVLDAEPAAREPPINVVVRTARQTGRALHAILK